MLAVGLAEPLQAVRRHNFRTPGSLAGSAAVTILISPPPPQTDDNILEYLGFPQQLIPASLLPLPQLPMMEPFGLGQLALPQVISALMALFFFAILPHTADNSSADVIPFRDGKIILK